MATVHLPHPLRDHPGATRTAVDAFWALAIGVIAAYVFFAALGHLRRRDERQRARDRSIRRGAARAFAEVFLDLRGPPRFAVVVQRQVVVGVMLHDVALRSGSRAARSLRTARNTLCFAALVPRPSVRLISSIERPS